MRHSRILVGKAHRIRPLLRSKENMGNIPNGKAMLICGRVPRFPHGNRVPRRHSQLDNRRTLSGGVHKTDIVLSAVLC